jgi:DNA excision repair protein ERCC-8
VSTRLLSLEFSHDKVIRSVHTGGVTCLDLDAVEQRYLLAGAADASIAVYDTQQPSSAAARQQQAEAREAAVASAAAAGSNAPGLRQSGQAAAAGANAEHSEHGALFSVTKQAAQGHRFSVTAVAWYPVDSGLFVSGRVDWPSTNCMRTTAKAVAQHPAYLTLPACPTKHAPPTRLPAACRGARQ